jgi:hypothetical protein
MSVTVTQVGDYVFMYAYPVAFAGAVFCSTTQFFGIDIATIMNDTVSQWLYVFVGVCGVVSMFTWFNKDVPYITGNLYDRGAVKSSI